MGNKIIELLINLLVWYFITIFVEGNTTNVVYLLFRPTGEQVSETTFEKYCWRICFSEVWEDENGDIHNESATICLGLISVQFFSENGMLYLQRTGDKENDRKIIFSGEEYNIMMK